MIALLGAGVCLILGIGMRIASIGAAILVMLMWLAIAPWASYTGADGATVASNNPIVDDHVVYAAVLLLLMFVHAGRYLGLGRKWEQITPSWLH